MGLFMEFSFLSLYYTHFRFWFWLYMFCRDAIGFWIGDYYMIFDIVNDSWVEKIFFL